MKDLQCLPSTALKQNRVLSPAPANPLRNMKLNWLHVLFGLVFIVLTGFMAALIGGLFVYGKGDFLAVLRNPEFRFALVFTLWTSVTATLLAALLAIPSGYILSRRRFPGKALIETLMDIPIVLPPLVSGVALLILMGPVLGEIFTKFSLDVVFTARGVVVAQCFIATPFAIRAFKQGFDSIDPRLEKVARTLGFSQGMVFLKVTLPLAKGCILSGLTMAWARALGEFGATAILAGITRMKTETLSVAIFLNMSIGDIQFAMSVSMIMLLLALFLMSLFKFFTSSEVSL